MTELVNDELGLMAALARTLFLYWGLPLGDPIAAIVVALIIAVNAVSGCSAITWASCSDARCPNSWPASSGSRSVCRGCARCPRVSGLHLVVPRGLPVEEAHRTAETVRARMHQETEGHYCVIQVEPTIAELRKM